MHTIKVFLRHLLPIGLVIGGALLLSLRITSLSIIFGLPIISIGLLILFDEIGRRKDFQRDKLEKS